MAGQASVVERARVAWVDTAKGIAIILVVLFHSVIFLEDVGLAGRWGRIDSPLDTFRMPLFFFTAGLFAEKALKGTFGDLWRSRIAKLVWLYALWSFIWVVAFGLIPLQREAGDGNPLELWLRSFVLPNQSTWFIYALAAYFAFAWLVRRLPAWLQIAPVAVLSAFVGSRLVDWPNDALEKTCMYLIFYLLAVHVSRFVRAAAKSARWWSGAAIVVAYVLVLIPAIKMQWLGFPGVRLLLGAVGVCAGIAVSVWVGRLRQFRWVAALGSRTLPIYLLHFYVVLGAVAVLAPFADRLGRMDAVLVPALTGLAIVVSLLVHRVTRRVPGLWDRPRLRRPARSAVARAIE